MKPIRIARNKFRDRKHTQLCYMTYVLTFPDGDQWTKQEPFSAHDLAHVLTNMVREHKRLESEWRHRAMALYKAGECWWKDEAGVEHLILIEKEKRKAKDLRWGVDKAGMATFSTETGVGV